MGTARLQRCLLPRRLLRRRPHRPRRPKSLRQVKSDSMERVARLAKAQLPPSRNQSLLQRFPSLRPHGNRSRQSLNLLVCRRFRRHASPRFLSFEAPAAKLTCLHRAALTMTRKKTILPWNLCLLKKFQKRLPNPGEESLAVSQRTTMHLHPRHPIDRRALPLASFQRAPFSVQQVLD